MLIYSWLENAIKEKGSGRALVYRDTYLSWRGLKHRVERRAQEFKTMGVRPGDFVGLMLGNVPDFIILSLALSKLRAAPVPLDPTTSTKELELLMEAMPIRGLITRPRGGDSPLPSEGGEERRFIPESRRRLQGTLLSCSIYKVPVRKIPRTPGDTDIAAVLITSDTAGRPKPVERTAANLKAEAAQLTEAVGITAEDRGLLTMPLFHSFGFDLGMVGCLSNGATLCLEDDVGAARIIKIVREHKVTILPGRPTLFAELARLPSLKPLSYKPAPRLLSLGGGLSGNVLEAFHKKYGVRPLGCFHTTETGTISIDMRGQAGATVGKVLPGIEVQVTESANREPRATGRKGVLWVRGPAVSPLKLGANGAGSVEENEGWFRTGDVACLDRARRITLYGREDGLVRVDGKRVALGEVQGCIEAFPKVREAQAALISDPLGGPMVVAKVVLKDRKKGIEPETIIDHCARNLAPYKVPRRIEICDRI